MHELITDEKRQLKLCDVAGLPIGHAPRRLSTVFRTLIETCESILSAIPTAAPVPSFSPWPPVSAKGGGVVIPCNYIIKYLSHLSKLHEKVHHLILVGQWFL